MEVPRTLRAWFVAHAVVAVAAALPLLLAPELALHRLGWTTVEPVTSRLLGAALLALGGQSFFARDAGVDVYRSILRFNAIWSLAGAGALFVTIDAGAPSAVWVTLSALIAFAGVWLHHAIRFRQHERVGALEDGPAPEDMKPDGAAEPTQDDEVN